MANREASATRDDEYHHVWSWLDKLDTTPSNWTDSPRQAKRRKTTTTNKRRQCRIPTPSQSSCASHKSASNLTEDKLKNMSRKRTRSVTDGEQQIALSDEEAVVDDTPKALQRGWRKDSRRSTPSLASSSRASGASSPIKQFRFAATQETGFTQLDFTPNIHQLPPSLKSLRRQLVDIGYGQDLLPSSIRQEVQDLGDFPRFAFYDSTTHANQWRIPSTAFVHQIVTRAAECNENLEGESSWNMDVHRCLLDFAFRAEQSNALIDYRYCTGAQIVPEYRPHSAPSKSVDFCLCIKPPQLSHEADIIDSLIKTRPGISINHTDWGNFCKHPIALSIETKRQAEWDRALLQTGTWHSAQWRALQFNANIKSIECLPGIIVQGHSWYFVASTLDSGRSKLYHELDIGSTKSHFDLYKLLISLQCLGFWIEHSYWPAFIDDVLKPAETTGL